MQELILFKEGLFWRGYEQSAYWLHRRFGFKPTKKYIKQLSQEVVSVGFPDASFRKFFPDAQSVGKECMIVVGDKDDGYYTEWKTTLPLRENKLSKQESTNSSAERVAERLRAFALENSTPMDCMNLVAELKRMLNADHV